MGTTVHEYLELDHAEVVPPDQLEAPDIGTYYLSMHGVAKESSTTTKLRVVFDASAKTSSTFSLNDTLLPGPCLYSQLTSVLNNFRTYPIGMSADVSRMFREVLLDQTERNFDHFLVEDADAPERPLVCRMKCLTFGVTSSPFQASQFSGRLQTTTNLTILCCQSHPQPVLCGRCSDWCFHS